VTLVKGATFSTIAGIAGVGLGCVVYDIPCLTFIGIAFLVEALILQGMALGQLRRPRRRTLQGQ
jgi:hypothetical protein